MLRIKNRIEDLLKKIEEAERVSIGTHPQLCMRRITTKLLKYITGKKTFPVLVTALVSFLNPVSILAADKYRNFEELKANELPFNFSIFSKEQDTDVLILAPHGGGIEGGTSELAKELSEAYSTYLFEALKTPGAFDLHLTSTNFDEPQALEMLKGHEFTLSLHGYASNDQHVLVGGTDREKAEAITNTLNNAGYSAELLDEGTRLSGSSPNNVANKNKTGKSIQLELSTGLRKSMFNTFSLKGRSGTRNKTFYNFIDTLSGFLNENVEGKGLTT
ncbi:poly-gamma-glutamate hydrolase family protein [Bacillus velezensis]|uniref:poly-gamma-glutamate hydrolase family protein n=1 Tax=Bacillus velezensis TaxID=492670 RepID=UPI0024533ABD|nr:poly-gamma-glutamate hydrolase family protein [Bacillus velezensis]MDH3102740.1 poly-gamma-glutamate hydrolase family protein [Bacillus velezensis]